MCAIGTSIAQITAPQNSIFEVTVDDLRRYDWQAELAAASRRECYAFNDVWIAKGT